MFAIELSVENLPKIRQLDFLSSVDKTEIEVYVRSDKTWYFVRGYVNSRGVLEPWAVFPEYILNRSYDFDPVKIQTDWGIIVRN